MTEIIDKIQEAGYAELQEIMKAIEKRYAVAFPDWDVTYMAVHKEYRKRCADTRFIIKVLKRGLRESKKQAKKDSLK